ncbi:little elongation complex subunit 2 isoform X2 [Varanus komodoensis]|uniref:little elongation complex subunit 2 isoform X2 n=1 Tax=Varanus komodoensis TaxID=61221 RepID=UPI001CF793F8|nr:little elongation complex subunit 2 isoform X2 [Varanus komodoensis]
MAAGGSLLRWDIPPQNGHGVYFSRDIYEKFSMAPSLSELLSKRHGGDNADTSNSGQGNCASSKLAPANPVKVTVTPSAEAVPFQHPRVPYTYFSSLTEKEQRRYLYLLSTYLNAKPSLIGTSEQKDYLQYLQMKEFVSKEVAEFQKFAQNAARSCAKDYDEISEEASLYVKKFLTCRIGYVKKYPECYTLHEVTSIMGGKFSTELTLKLEKSLLALGKVNFIKRYFPKLPTSIQLPDNSDNNELGILTPEQRASVLHDAVSRDPNAEKLAAKYCPQVVLTSESLFTLLNNHGLDYRQQWELPVSVKTISAEGLKPVKVVYLDPPLPKKEMTIREKNQVFHEFLLDFHMTKRSHVVAHAIILDKAPEVLLEAAPEDCHARRVPVADSTDIDFNTDVTELETFGSTSKLLNFAKQESTPTKPAFLSKTLSKHPKVEKESVWGVNSEQGEGSRKAGEQRTEFSSRQNLTETPPSGNEVLGLKDNASVKDFKAMAAEPESQEESLGHALFGSSNAKDTLKEGTDVAPDVTSTVPSHHSDTDEESLVIDTECTESGRCEQSLITSSCDPQAYPPESPCSEEACSRKLADPSALSEQEVNVPPEHSKLLSEKADPLGQILKMQAELHRSPSPNHRGQPQSHPERSLSLVPSQEHTQPETSLPSTPEPGQSAAADTSSSFKFTWATNFQASQKRASWDAAEDRSEYTLPPQGNAIYKLFRLDSLLLLVRCSVQKAELRPRNKKVRVKRHFPVYVLPKLEYQPFYGAEALSESEICQLWTESLLHSNSSFAVGHIDALTSQLFLLERLSAEDLKKRFGTFKPANSLNILQHLLKTVTALQEGSYLLAHAAGDASVAIYRRADEKAPRTAYNLHAAHADLPGVPSTLSVPWVPLDPSLPLPAHFAQGRVPCTFPPKPAESTKKPKMSGTNASPGTPSCGEQVSMETDSSPLPANPSRKRHGALQTSAAMRNIRMQASRGPNWKFWKKASTSKDKMTS